MSRKTIGGGEATPYVELDRPAWARLAEQTPLPLNAEELERLRGLGDEIDLTEVAEVYLPLTRLLNLYVRATDRLHEATQRFLGPELAHSTNGNTEVEPDAQPPTPYVIGIAGSVAVGKSTVARVLRELLARWPDHPRVQLVTTDGFLWPKAELERRGLMERKGFPESFDQRSLLRFVVAVKSGVPTVTAPVYSHLTYDIVPGETREVHRPDILLVEGLNVLQPARTHADGRRGLAVSDFFDFTIYLDAQPADVRRWYVERFLKLRETVFRDPASYFRRYADLTSEQAIERAGQIWDTINGPNLTQNIAPTRGRAKLVLHKASDHSVRRVRLRKI